MSSENDPPMPSEELPVTPTEEVPHQEAVPPPAPSVLLTQADFLALDWFPMEVNQPAAMLVKDHIAVMRALGFVIVSEELSMEDAKRRPLWKVMLPAGWTKHAAPKSDVWNYLVDEHGRNRAALYFRDMGTQIQSYVNWMTRYRPVVKHTAIGVSHAEYMNSPMMGYVTDAGVPLFSTGPVQTRLRYGAKKYAVEEKATRLKVYNKCKKWADEHYAGWDNILAYWDDLPIRSTQTEPKEEV